MLLLDTNVCVEFLRNRNPRVVQAFASYDPSELRVCSVVVGELYYGAFKSSHQAANLALLGKFLAQFLSLPFDDAAAQVYGRIRADLERAGGLIGPNDLMIAAIALAHGATLVSHNTIEFGRVPNLTVVDWHG